MPVNEGTAGPPKAPSDVDGDAHIGSCSVNAGSQAKLCQVNL